MHLAPLAPSIPVVVPPPTPVRCLAYVAALRSAIGRDEAALAELRRLESQARPGGRGQGLEWAIAETEQTIAMLGEIEALVRTLAPVLPEAYQLAGEGAAAEMVT